jgi:hypothetical protein
LNYTERKKWYNKVGSEVTEVFKSKYPNIRKVTIFEQKPIIVRGIEFYDGLHLRVYVLSNDVYVNIYDIEKFIRNYFNIITDSQFKVIIDKCPDSKDYWEDC